MYSKRHYMSFTFATVLILKKGSYLNILVSAKAVNKDEKWDRSLENSSITPITDLNNENTVEWVESNNMLTAPTALTNESITSNAGRPAAEMSIFEIQKFPWHRIDNMQLFWKISYDKYLLFTFKSLQKICTTAHSIFIWMRSIITWVGQIIISITSWVTPWSVTKTTIPSAAN